jgi:MinD-like ATPase involved in chromosome partitioning or flagellar assembly
VHLILQGKGGVGKSLISAILGQYFLHKKITPHCFDTDPVNATFAQYQALQAEHINVLRRGAINPHFSH